MQLPTCGRPGWEAGEYREIQTKHKYSSICDKKMKVLSLLPPSALILKGAFKRSNPSTKKRSFGLCLKNILTLMYLNSDRVR